MKFHDLESPEKWIAALNDERLVLRTEVLNILTQCSDPPSEALIPALNQVDRHGWSGSFEYPNMITSLPHTEESFAWLVRRLHALAPQAGVENELMHLSRWFCDGPIELVTRHIDDFLETIKASPHPGSDSIRGTPLVFRSPGASFEKAADRLHLHTLNTESLMSRADELLDACSEECDFPAAEVNELEMIARILVERDQWPKEAVGDWLDIDPLDLDSDLGKPEYRAGFALLLLTEARVAPPLDRLLNLLELDWDWMNELCQEALTAANDAGAIAELLTVFPTLEWYQRLHMGGAIEDSWQPENESAVMDVADHEEDDEIRVNLVAPLVLHGSPDARAFALGIANEAPEDPERKQILEYNTIRETVCGRETPATRAHLKRMDNENQRVRERLASLDRGWNPAQPPKPKPAAGRNDPCPCGSGKKYKKCCLV